MRRMKTSIGCAALCALIAGGTTSLAAAQSAPTRQRCIHVEQEASAAPAQGGSKQQLADRYGAAIRACDRAYGGLKGGGPVGTGGKPPKPTQPGQPGTKPKQ